MGICTVHLHILILCFVCLFVVAYVSRFYHIMS